MFGFTKREYALWGGSLLCLLVAFLLFDRTSWLSLIASAIGVTALIFNAKGNPFGQLLMILFSLFYGYISFTFAYYGEMITYLGMTAPMALLALITWLRHPYKGHRTEVAVARLKRGEVWWMLLLTALVTAVFYPILRHFHTENLLPSTLSVTTSFLAVYLTFRRNPFFALAYAANDVILIVLWTLASQHDPTYISVTVCFISFLVNDLYGFWAWRKMERKQNETEKST